MKIGLRILLGYFLIVGLAAWFLLNVFMEQVKPGVRSTLEDTLVDTSQLLASLVAPDMRAGALANSPVVARMQDYARHGVDININGRQIHSDGNGTLPKAEITPQGDLLIEGKAVTITAAQRAELLAYRGQILGIAEAGMAIGAQGANIAGHAVSGAIGAIFGGKDGEKEFEKKMEAEAAKIEAEAMKLCTRLPALMAGQQALAASLPEFKPYARMTQADVDDCGKDVGKDKGVAVTSG